MLQNQTNYDYVVLIGGPKDGETVLAHRETTLLEIYVEANDSVVLENPVKYIYERGTSYNAAYVGYEHWFEK